MVTYIVLNIVVMVVVLAVFARLKMLHWNTLMWYLLLVMLLLTAIFDSVIIGIGVVDYDYSKTLGIRIGYAPIEDFMYAILAVLIIPAIWKKMEILHVRKNT